MPWPERRDPRDLDVLGVRISAITMNQALDTIDDWIVGGAHQYVCVTGVHGVMESQRDAELRRIHNAAGLVTPDGMPLVWLSRWQGRRDTARVCGRDLMLACCQRSMTTGYRHYFYGGLPGIADRLAARLRKRFPGLAVAGTYSPPFGPVSPEEDEQIIQQINESQADIVWVGLSTPKQERWMAAHLGRVNAAVMLGVGAAFDFHAGTKPEAPAWMQRAALEWLFRLACEPRRLWRRYLLNNPAFIWLVARQLWQRAPTGGRARVRSAALGGDAQRLQEGRAVRKSSAA